MFQQGEQEVSAFDSAFVLEAREEDEKKGRKRIYWRDLIQREEQKVAEEENKAKEEANLARMKLE